MKTQTLKNSDASTSISTKSQSLAKQKLNERPLVEDIRLLGRILGDVIREQEGAAAYELIEQIRKLSVAFRRDEDHTADKALKKLLKGLTGDQTVSVIRAFTYFSHLANLAEDRHHIRRREVHERVGDTQEGSVCAGRASHPKPSPKLWQKAMFPQC
jgi:phosphoenolpyruvate carboxylase